MAIKKRKPDLGIWYTYINMYLLKYCDNDRLIERREIIRILGEVSHIEKLTRNKIFKELTDYGYITFHSRGRDGCFFKVLG